MQSIDPNALSRREAYTLLTSLVVPRPIAWVTTVSPDGAVNLAPFSYFNAVSSTPPVIMFCVGRRKGERKDTSRNILETGEFCVNVATVSLAEAVTRSAADWPADVSEVEACGLTTTPSEVVRPPRIAESPVALECVLVKALEEEDFGTTVIFGRIERIHVAESVLADGDALACDPARLAPLARLGGTTYADLGRLFDQATPRVDYQTGEEKE